MGKLLMDLAKQLNGDNVPQSPDEPQNDNIKQGMSTGRQDNASSPEQQKKQLPVQTYYNTQHHQQKSKAN